MQFENDQIKMNCELVTQAGVWTVWATYSSEQMYWRDKKAKGLGQKTKAVSRGGGGRGVRTDSALVRLEK